MENNEKPCIVSFSSQGRENYNSAMLRLISTSKECGYEGDFLLHQFDGYVPDYRGVYITQGKSLNYPQPEAFQCYNHAEVPYLFKLAMIQIAREKGYKQVIWCDSTICMVKAPLELLEVAKQTGVVAFDNLGHPLRPWISDIALERLEISEDELHHVPQIMACVIIFDFSNQVAVEVFDEWVKFAQDGTSFQNSGSKREGFKAHRHDQAILSGILYKKGIKLREYGDLVYEPNDVDLKFGDKFTFVNRGIK